MNSAVPLAAVQRIDAACDRFEADWKAGKAPRIEDYLTALAGVERAELLRALLGVELELRALQGQPPDPVAYRARFPADSNIVDAAVQSTATGRGAKPAVGVGDTSVSGKSVSTGEVAPRTAPPPPAARAVEPAPKQLGRFKVIEILGEGAFGRVYRAHDPQLDREVAIKVPRKDALTQDELDRFLREARSAATLHHANICPVYEVGQEGDHFYLVMAYVPGKSLAAHLKDRQGPMPEKQAALIVRKLALALEVAHAKGIIHRDLKPGNIMFDRDRKDVVVMDFGLARRNHPDEAQLTQSGMVMGTPAYMPPEQARGDLKAIGPASDVYSLGVILYEMLAGRRPFTGSMAEVLSDVLHTEPAPPSRHRPGVDVRLETICLKAIAKDPALRYPSMKAMAEALNNYLKDEAVPAASAAPVSATAKVAGPETEQFADLFAALSDERRQQTSVLAAALRKSRTPWWVWVAGFGFVGAILLGGIIFFARTPTATVLIQIDVDLKDKSLSFLLDGNGIMAEDLTVPIELKVGDHELVVSRGKDIVKHLKFTVKGGPTPEIAYKEVRPPDAGKVERAKPPQPFGPLVFDHSLTKADTLDKLQLAFGQYGGIAAVVSDGLKMTGGHSAPMVWPKPYVGDRVRAEFEVQLKDRTLAGWTLNGPGYGNSPKTGYYFTLDQTTFWFYREDVEIKTGALPKPLAPGEWVRVQADSERGKITIALNGVAVIQYTDAQPLTDSLHGWFGLEGNGADGAVFRNLRLWSAAPDTKRARQLTPPVTEKAVANGKLLYEFKPAGGQLGAEWRDLLTGPATVENGVIVLNPQRLSNDSAELILTQPLSPDLACEVEFEYPTYEAVNLDIMLRFAKQVPPAAQDEVSGWLVRLPQGNGRTGLQWRSHTKEGWDKIFVVGQVGDSTPYYAPVSGRKYLARIEMRGDQLRLFLDGGLMNTARRPADKPVPALPLFFGLRETYTGAKFHAVRIYQLAPNQAADPDRKAAEWMLKFPATSVAIRTDDGQEILFAKLTDLPARPFHLVRAAGGGPGVTDAELAVFHGLKSLRMLHLNNCPELTDAGLQHLKDLAQLEELYLDGTAVAQLQPLRDLAKLHSLSLIGARQVDDGALANLKGLKLTWLALRSTAVTNLGLRHLQGHVELDLLDLEDTAVTDAGLEHLKGLSKLAALRVARTKVTAAGVKKLAAALPQCRITSDFGTIEPKPSIDPDRRAAEWVLRLGGQVQITVAGQLQNVKNLTELPPTEFKITKIETNGKPLNEADLVLLEGLTDLDNLTVRYTPLTGSGLVHVRGLPNLWEVALEGTNLPDSGLQYLHGLPKLHIVRLDRTQITDAGLAHLKGLDLHILNIDTTAVTGPGLENLSGMANLTELWAGNAKINDAGLKHLQGLKNLRHLGLGRTSVTDAGLEHLKPMTQLVRLHLEGTQITDAGLVHLHGLQALQTLLLGETKVTAAGVQKLKAALPNCNISR